MHENWSQRKLNVSNYARSMAMPLQALSDGTRLHIERSGKGIPTLVPCIASSIPYEVSFGKELKLCHRILRLDT